MIASFVSLLLAVSVINIHHCRMSPVNIDGRDLQDLPPLDLDNRDLKELSPMQTMLEVSLAIPVTIDRKIYRNMWIYRNGFVTLGSSLDENAFPVTLASPRSHMPLENLQGERIIAVFVTPNRRNPDSKVRVKEITEESITNRSKEAIDFLKRIVSRSFGSLLVGPIEAVVVVEWVDMEVDGEESEKNSFRLFILSNKAQSFAIFHYENIKVVSYRLSGETHNYQAGLQSYANRHFLMPFYNVSAQDVPITRSSNIGMKNVWILNVGDSSYSIDSGFPTQDSNKPLKGMPRTSSTSSETSHIRTMPTKGKSTTQLTKIIKFSIKKNPTILFKRMTSDPISSPTTSLMESTVPSTHSTKVLDLRLGLAVKTIKTKSPQGKLRPTRDQGYCQRHSCAQNENCLDSNGSPCCHCAAEMVHTGSRCSIIGDSSGMSAYGFVLMPHEGQTMTLDLNLNTGVSSNQAVTYLTITSRQPIGQDLRNFLILLNPIFSIPILFYSKSWKRQQIPNLSSFVKDHAAASIWTHIDGYGQMYITFSMNRTTGDYWNITINTLEREKMKALNLGNIKLDEKASKPLMVSYNLTRSNLVHFPTQVLTFSDEDGNRTFNVSWRGTMTLSETCLARHIGSRLYTVKFPDTGYCNTDCVGSKNEICRVFCLRSPTVFETPPGNLPGPCEGIQCQSNMVCVEDSDRYDCKCPPGLHETREGCVRSPRSTSAPTILRRPCAHCSVNAGCGIINGKGCCFCHSAYIGSGNRCYARGEEYQITFLGSLVALQGAPITKDINISVMFRQYLDANLLETATFVQMENVEVALYADLIYLLSPIFDVSLTLFARDSHRDLTTNIYSLSKGSLQLRVLIDGLSQSGISIIFDLSEKKDYGQITVTIPNIPRDIDPSLLTIAKSFFENRKIPDIKYRIKGRRITLEEYEILPLGRTGSQTMRVSGQGLFDECSDQDDQEKTIIVAVQKNLKCGVNCKEQSCNLFCQARTVQTMDSKKCGVPCHDKATCIGSVCVCRSGFSGDGIFCRQIMKDLECSFSADCMNRTFLECRDSKCTCKPGTVMRDNQCTYIDPCQNCGLNEICFDSKCQCRPHFQRNRVSQLCTFDCSQCDIYSTSCTSSACSCKDRYVYETNVTCTLRCQTDDDCPSNEVCGALLKCFCPFKRIDGLCYPGRSTTTPREYQPCSRNAIYQNNKCTCLPDWTGNGFDCQYNCSLCFQPLYCNPDLGCSCPPDFVGDGKTCFDRNCINCPVNSNCVRTIKGSICQCNSNMMMSNGLCVHDPVQIIIIPQGPIAIREGDPIDLICIGSSKIRTFELQWSRTSGRLVSGVQSYNDASNTSLRLYIKSSNIEDVDEYTCRSSSGESSSTIVILEGNVCRVPCHADASCVSGRCQCPPNYTGDGITCRRLSNCSEACPSNMICDEAHGRCRCAWGYRENQSKCTPDCQVRKGCDGDSVCDPVSGLCKCSPGYKAVDGMRCWKKRTSCLLTKKCGDDASCVHITVIQQHVCVCNAGFVGNGTICYQKIDCSTHRCGKYAFCEPLTVVDHLDISFINGKCYCEPGYSMVDGTCQDSQLQKKVIWMSMGEAIISLGLNGNKSQIRYIDTMSSENASNGGITVLSGDCDRRRLYWSGEKGSVIRWSEINDPLITNASTLMSGFLKVTGLSVDEITGNVFFADSYSGKIGVIDPSKNLSRILLEKKEYRPGQIVAHSPSGSLFWTVLDFINPRIDTSLMTGEGQRVFVRLNNFPVSLTIVPRRDGGHELCWVEAITRNNYVTKAPLFGFLKCVNISDQTHVPAERKVYTIRSEEPSSALTYSEKFYWGVRSGKYLRRLDQDATSKVPIDPSCCDVGVLGLVILPDVCPRGTGKARENPCQPPRRGDCQEICVQKMATDGRTRAICLKGDRYR